MGDSGTLGFYWDYIGVMQGLYRGYIGVILPPFQSQGPQAVRGRR